jgi:uncharacterized alpha-E superfamily protein
MAFHKTSPRSTEHSTDKISSYLEELNVLALSAANAEDYETSLHFLGKSQELLEALKTQGKDVNADYVLLTLHNTAYCYQR